MSNFGWGILGSGGIARRFAEDLALIDGHVVAAVGSRSQESADKFAADFPGCMPNAKGISLSTLTLLPSP